MNPTRKNPITVIALFIMLLIAFFAWVVLRRQTNDIHEPPPTASTQPKFEVNIPQKALLKNYINISMAAPPGTECNLIYVSPLGNIHENDTTANADGLCMWRWKMDESEGKGSGRLIFTVNGISETHFMEIFANF
jgi:hypothetical protein